MAFTRRLTTDGCEAGFKRCSTCKEAKPFEAFCKCSSTRDGYQFSCKKCKAQMLSKWEKANPDNVVRNRKRHRSSDDYKTKRREYNRDYEKKKKETSINYRISRNLRIRFVQALKGNAKTGSAVRDLGCTIEQFKDYISALFQPGMSWDNWGKTGWHLDHKIPLSAFDLTKEDQVRLACHFSNLQPMWAKENLQKGAKYGVPAKAND